MLLGSLNLSFAAVQNHHEDADLAQNGRKAGEGDGAQPVLTQNRSFLRGKKKKNKAKQHNSKRRAVLITGNCTETAFPPDFNLPS